MTHTLTGIGADSRLGARAIDAGETLLIERRQLVVRAAGLLIDAQGADRR